MAESPGSADVRSAGLPSARAVPLTAEGETLVIPLYARALDYRSSRSLLQDARSSEIVASLDYDFERLRSPGRINLMTIRARLLDDWIGPFLGSHPSASVLNLGCGLDTRIDRFAPGPGIAWFDVDFPAVIAFRRNFFPERLGYRMVPSSLTDPGWIGEVPTDRPAVVIADGVLEYLPPTEVGLLVTRLVDRIPHGIFVFDVMSSAALRRGNARLRTRSTAQLRWPVDELTTVDALVPGWRRTGTVSLLETRYVPWTYRWLARISRFAQSSIRVLRYEF